MVDIVDQADRVLVKVSAPVAFKVPISPELFEWMARHSGDLHFGGFELFDEDEGTINSLLRTSDRPLGRPRQ